jgi:hypothetical protein
MKAPKTIKARAADGRERLVGFRNQKRDEVNFVAPVIRWGSAAWSHQAALASGPTRRGNRADALPFCWPFT